jgi:hypothetical protein
MESKQYTEKQLFDSLISQTVYGIWIALGKIQNPMTKESSVDLTSATIQIDMLDMIKNRMEASLSSEEKDYLSKVLSELKMNYIEVEKSEKSKENLNENNDSSAEE